MIATIFIVPNANVKTHLFWAHKGWVNYFTIFLWTCWFQVCGIQRSR
jgi:hypothetical protein